MSWKPYEAQKPDFGSQEIISPGFCIKISGENGIIKGMP
jgi:hypothetical protein